MCGIVGVLQHDGQSVEPGVLRRMTDALAHRGPDGEGWFADGPVGFGHRRLAIIDTSPAGHQPMATADGRFVLTYNGELYNFQELRLELEATGCQFRSRSDTEVVLQALARWGAGAVPRFNGMFAFALWDRVEGRLLLARDRYGIKPLYTATIGNCFAFSSEIKAFYQLPSFRAELDRESLAEYLTFQNIFSTGTLFRGVDLLPAGHTLELRAGAAPKLHQYWDFHFEDAHTGDEREVVEELDRLFRTAVSRQLVSDVPVGSYLSGGMDSGSIVAIATKQIENLASFTVGFDLHSASGIELAYDERELAEHLSYLFSTEHFEMVLKAGDMERALPDLVWHLEDLRVGQSYPNFYAARLASKFVKVVLSGAGGDELFAGYPWRYYRAAVNDSFESYVDRYHDFWQRLVPAQHLPGVLAPIWSSVAHVDTRELVHDVFMSHAQKLERPEDYINHSLYFEAKTFLHGLLVVEDKLSMAHGLETRVPFLDNDLVDFAQRIPAHLKLGNLGEVVRLNENEPGLKTQKYFDETRDGKLILRKMLSAHVPDLISKGVKRGFSAPDASWFRGDSMSYVERRVLSRDAMINEYLDPGTVHGLVEEHMTGKVNRRLLLWSLLCLEEWLHAFVATEGRS
jgi:asparagine synthase (glutamine-hydrolysing)